MPGSRSLIALLALAAGCAATTAPAVAAAPARSTVKIALASPAKGKSKPTFSGVALSARSPARVTRSAITLTGGTPRFGTSAKLSLGGRLVLRRGRRSVTLTSLQLIVTGTRTRLSARVGRTRVTILESRTGTKTAGRTSAVKLRRGSLKLTSAGAKALGRRLRVRLKAKRTLGVVSGTLRPDPGPTVGSSAPPVATPAPAPVTPVAPATVVPAPAAPAPVTPAPVIPAPDPEPVVNAFTAPCLATPAALPAAGPGTPAPAPLPALAPTAAVAATSSLAWGVRESWRWYLKNLGGLTAAWDGATAGPDVVSAMGPAYGSYTFPGTTGGVYEQALDPAGDRAIVPLRGRVDFCHGTHRFRITLSRLTAVIDGANSRIVADADTNHDGTLSPNERVDVASLNLAGIVPVRSGSTVTWTAVPATFTEGGSGVFSGGGGGGGGSYPPGAPMDPVTLRAELAPVAP